jgi:hypothetical protein
MNFSLDKSLQILQRTPSVLSTWTDGLDDCWITNNEGAETWTVKDVIAHLIVCENTNWLTRTRIILAQDPDLEFVPIDMISHLELANNHSIMSLIDDFTRLRASSITELISFNLSHDDLEKRAFHPILGEVNLQQLLATWVCHDLSHIAQISRIMAFQYKEEVGPFKTFLRFINRNQPNG